MSRRKKMKSIRVSVLKLILVISTIIILSTAAFEIVSFKLFTSQSISVNQLILNARHHELDTLMYETAAYCRNFAYLNSDVASLNTDDSIARYNAEYNVRMYLRDRLAASSKLDAIYILDTKRNKLISSYGNSEYSQWDMDDEIREFAQSPDFVPSYEWQIHEFQGIPFLYHSYIKGKLILFALIDLSDFAAIDTTNLGEFNAFITFYDGTRYYTNLEEVAKVGEISPTTSSDSIFLGKYVYESELDNSPIKMYLITSQDDLATQLKISIILIATTVLVIITLSFFMYKYLHNISMYPVENVMHRIESMSNNQSEMVHGAGILEYKRINESLDTLIKTLGDLKGKWYEESLSKQQAELQYYQLQTEPHFFLNVLKNISVLAENHQYDKIVLISIAFSTHIRYIFNNNKKLVTVKCELEDVDAYLRIVQMKTGKPILLEKKIEEGLFDCLVPILSIETFVENSINYALADEETLHILINIRKLKTDDGEYMEIRVEDNGKGFAKEALEKLNQAKKQTYASEGTGIINLIKRTEILFDIEIIYAFYNKQDGGAVSMFVLPMKEVLEHESSHS